MFTYSDTSTAVVLFEFLFLDGHQQLDLDLSAVAGEYMLRWRSLRRIFGDSVDFSFAVLSVDRQDVRSIMVVSISHGCCYVIKCSWWGLYSSLNGLTYGYRIVRTFTANCPASGPLRCLPVTCVPQ